MEVNNNIQPKNLVKEHANSINVKNTHHPSFGAGFLGNGVISTMDAIDRGGLVASFLVQDFFGMNIPRTLTGLYRNSELTGEYNYQEAAEVAIREFVSGPAMFAIPMLMLWGIKSKFGKSNDVPVKIIQAMGDKFSETIARCGSETLKNSSAEMKKQFYTDVFRNIFANAYKDNATPELVAEKASHYAEKLIEIETTKIKKSFFKRLRNIRVENSAQDMLSDLAEELSEIRKRGSVNSSAKFTEIVFSTSNEPIEKDFDKFTKDLKNFSDDIIETLSKKTKNTVMDEGAVKNFIKHFADLRSGSRVLTNFAMLAGIIGFCSYIPKLYQLSKTNPGLNGLENPSNAPQKTETQTKTEDDKNAAGKNVSFCGAVDTLGRAASKEKSRLAKFLSAFEFSSYNSSLIGFLTACGLGIVTPRLVHAREENEYKEVLFRDTTTVATVVFAAKALQHIFGKICTNLTGFALTRVPEEDKNIFKKLFDYIRPEKGVHSLSSAELAAHYTNVENYQDGIVGFMNFIDKQGGNLRKMFSSNKKAENLLKQLYNIVGPEVPYESASNRHIISVVGDVVESNADKNTLEELYKFFKNNKDNTFLRKAKVLNSSFNFASLFIVVPVLLGWAIPRMNESFTKKRELEKHKTGQETNKSSVAKIMQTSPVNKNKNISKTAFEDFAAKN